MCHRMPDLSWRPQNVVDLSFVRCRFRSFKDLVALVWSCPNLESLVLKHNAVPMPDTATEVERMLTKTYRPPRACVHLTRLVLAGHPLNSSKLAETSILRLFGLSVQALCLYLDAPEGCSSSSSEPQPCTSNYHTDQREIHANKRFSDGRWPCPALLLQSGITSSISSASRLSTRFICARRWILSSPECSTCCHTSLH
ncbi:hypothetical protein C8Q79DRAFT_328247 [Trametes meyenii]|nr:hypothetical protein C8Q79DRAFT_328247 [Trametes meyenii]